MQISGILPVTCGYFGAGQEIEVTKGHVENCQRSTKKLLKQMDSTESRPAAQNTSTAEFLTNLNRHYILTQITVRPLCFQFDSGSLYSHSQHNAELQTPLSFFPQILSLFFTGRERWLELKVLFAFQN